LQFAGGINPIQDRHTDIKDGDIGAEVGNQPDDLLAVRCLSGHLETLSFQERF
jgi:hypothetical protein